MMINKKADSVKRLLARKSGVAKPCFTAAPWTAEAENGGFIEIVDKDGRLIMQIMSDGLKAKKAEGCVPTAEAEANKQLVLASPGLYRNLKTLTERLLRAKSALLKVVPDLAGGGYTAAKR